MDCLIGMLALSGVTISGDVYSWITVFVLPINSALNPFLYTLLAIMKKEVKKTRVHILSFKANSPLYFPLIF